jgi:hypothetical protein
MIGDPYSAASGIDWVSKVLQKMNNGRMNKDKVKIEWQQLPGNKLKATWTPGSRGFEYGLTDADMDPVQAWCVEIGVGTRISFDMWRFRTAEEMTAFLLRWS